MNRNHIMDARLPEHIFGSDLTQVRRAYLTLAHSWHPDTSQQLNPLPVFQRLHDLYEEATSRMKRGLWPLQFAGVFEYGKQFIAPGYVAWEFTEASRRETCMHQASGSLKRVTEAPGRIAAEIGKQCPGPWVCYATSVRTTKAEDTIRLQDMLQHLTAPAHVGWLLSSLYSLCCGLEACGLVHCAIGPDTVYVSPERHLAAVCGGWWWARGIGETLEEVPRLTAAVLPWKVRAERKAMTSIDLECVRHLGARLAQHPPEPMQRFFNNCSSGRAVEDYAEWTRVLEACFGARKFLRLNITPEMIYGKWS